MDAVSIVVEVKDGVATVADITVPRGLTVRIFIRDYDTDGCDLDDLNNLDTDEQGKPYFETIEEYPALSARAGFV